jgi:hypothetical protein
VAAATASSVRKVGMEDLEFGTNKAACDVDSEVHGTTPLQGSRRNVG